MTDRVVVVGGGLAGARCLQLLRSGDQERELVLLSEENHLPYDRPPLTKAALKDGTVPPQLVVGWDALDIETRLGVKVVGLDPNNRTVRLADGSTVEYGSLVIATGAEPRRLSGLGGSRAEGVHVIRTVEDAAALRADLILHGRLTIIGGGFIGCEVASTAATLRVEVTLLEALASPLARVLGESVGAELGSLHRRAGIDVRTDSMVTEIRGVGVNRKLILTDRSSVAAPVVLLALGVCPSVDWLEESGITIQEGVVCDAFGRTNLPNIYAAGDVAVWLQPSTGRHARLEHWTSASAQARTVARAILGTAEPLDEVAYFWSEQLGVKMHMLGTPAETDEVTIIGVPGSGSASEKFVALYGWDGRLTAAFGVGAPRQVMSLRTQITEGADYATAVASVRSLDWEAYS